MLGWLAIHIVLLMTFALMVMFISKRDHDTTQGNGAIVSMALGLLSLSALVMLAIFVATESWMWVSVPFIVLAASLWSLQRIHRNWLGGRTQG